MFVWVNLMKFVCFSDQVRSDLTTAIDMIRYINRNDL